MSLKIGTLNINGLRGRQSQEELVSITESYPFDVLFLQETHVDNNNLAKFIESRLNMTCFWSFGTNKIAGTSICISKSLNIDCQKFDVDLDGRIVCLDMILDGSPFRLINIYAPNESKNRIAFFHSLTKYLVCNRYIIFGGDFNCVSNTKIDKFGRDISYAHGHLGSKDLNILVSEFQLQDIFRKNNPNKIVATWHCTGKDIHCRLDRFYVSKTLANTKVTFNILPFTKSDHELFLMSIPDIKKGKFGPSYWKFNNDLLKDNEFVESCRHFLNYHVGKFDHSLDSWDKLKTKIKTFCISYSKKRARSDFQQLHKLRKDYSNLILHEKYNPGDFKEQFEAIKLEINSLENKKYEGAKIRAKCKTFEDNENISNYFHKKENRNAQKRTINEIRKDGTSYTEQGDVMNCFEAFYKELYTAEPIDRNTVEFFLNDIPRLSSNDAQSLEDCISKAECLNALKGMDYNKSPGPDGITKEFYLTFFDILADALEKVIQNIHLNKSLTDSQKLSYISLLCKDTSKPSDMKNWRPISLLNVDYKIISKVLANRLSKVIANIIHPDQTCGIRSRSIFDNIHLLRNIIDYVNQKNLPCIFLNLDQEKAFDRVSYDFLFTVLERFGFSPNFIQWVKILYNDISSSVIVNNYISNPFNICRGVRQGCSLSPLLYVLVIEPLANKLRTDSNIKGFSIPGSSEKAKISLYADDGTAILTDLLSVKAVLHTCKHFGKASGAKLNLLKTKGIFLGKWKHREDHPFGISWVDNCKILGVKLGNFLSDDEIWNDTLLRFCKCLNLCKARNIPLKGKSLIVNGLACSKLWFLGMVLIPPKHYLTQFERAAFNFMWNNKVEALSRKSMQLPFSEGGQNVVSIQHKLASFLLKHVQQIIGNHEAKWKYFAIYWLGMSLRHLRPDFASLKIPHSETMPQFYHLCMKAFQDFQTSCHNFKLGNLPVKVIYHALTTRVKHNHVVTRKVPLIKFEIVWKLLTSKFIDPFVRDFCWKIAHDILPLNSLLFKRKITNQINCVLCETLPETVMHLFVECPVVKPLFNVIDQWCKRLTATDRSVLTHDFIKYHLLPIKLRDQDVFNTLVAIVSEFKYAVWMCRLLKKYDQKNITSNSLILFFISKLKLRIQSDFKRFDLITFIDTWVISGFFCGVEINEYGNKLNFFI